MRQLVERVGVVGDVARVDLRGAMEGEQRLERLVDEAGLGDAGAQVSRGVEEVRVDGGAQACASHATATIDPVRSGLPLTVSCVPASSKQPEPFPGFARFRDDPDAPFYASRMPGVSTPEATAAEIVACFSRVVYAVMRDASRRPRRMSRADLLRWHRATFRTTFPYQAGRLREDATAFEIRLREDGELRKGPLGGSRVDLVPAELDAAFAVYNAELDARRPEQRTLRDAVTVAAALYVELLRTHPFEEGNLRAAFPALQGALISLGATAVDFDDAVGEHDEALGWALLPDRERRSLEPFVDLLVQRIARAATER